MQSNMEKNVYMLVEKGAFKFTDKLKKWLDLKGWTQRELAKEIDCDESLVSQWFNEKNPKTVSRNYLRKLCLLTGLDVGELITFDRDLEQED